MIISERDFRVRLELMLDDMDTSMIGAVTGPGRSGAIAAVYASHYLGIPFIHYGQKAPAHLGDLLIIDTARQSGKTLRKATRRYPGATPVAVFEEPPRVTFWYEHEAQAA